MLAGSVSKQAAVQRSDVACGPRRLHEGSLEGNVRVPQAADVRDVGLPPLAHLLREVAQRISTRCGDTLCFHCVNEG